MRRRHGFDLLFLSTIAFPGTVLALALGCVSVASAQEPGEPPTPNVPDASHEDPPPEESPAPSETPDEGEAPVLVPPRLVEFVEAEYPASAREARREGVVVLRISIAADGNVIDSEVVTSAGEILDAAARDASLRFVFDPATRDGQPVAARILYTYEFKLPEEPAVPAADETIAPAEIAPDEEEVLEVTVEGQTEVEKLRRSALAVRVVDLENVKRRTADMGEVLARVEGVGVRRAGGLGSETRFMLNGLTDDQIRFFLDGIPIEFVGFRQGIANVPLQHFQRVEIYRGVVPIRFGADALGGAIHLVHDPLRVGSHGVASIQAGSFGTYRFLLRADHLDEKSGVFVRTSSYFDHADNDYVIDVNVADERGRLSPAQVRRFHDGFRAYGGIVEAGVVDRSFADRLSLQAYTHGHTNELQHNIVMTVPYGEASWGQKTHGANARYEKSFTRSFRVDAVAGYAHGRTDFEDLAEHVYDWYGRQVAERRRSGETDSRPYDRTQWENAAHGRVLVAWTPDPSNALRLSLVPTYVTRTGVERTTRPGSRDPQTAERDLTTMVSGVEYERKLWHDRLENIAFAKNYLYFARAEEPLPGDILRNRDADIHRFGAGNSLRFNITDSLYTKGSYEYATRLPRPDEVFGNGVLILANLGLRPEVSHNANLGLTFDRKNTPAGRFFVDANLFGRFTDQQIVLLGNDRVFSFQNVYGARSVGVEGSVEWTSLGDYVRLGGNATWMEFRNTSREGTFGAYEGDRIPNRPWLFANGWAELRFRDVVSENDDFSINWHTRYSHGFFRGWESLGDRRYKQTVPNQLQHNVGLFYRVEKNPYAITSALEVHNIFDAQVFDFFGVQRPGRNVHARLTLEY